MTGHARTLTYPAEGLGAPKDRHLGPLVDSGLPADVEVFSADDHISLAVDIFYERLPEDVKDQAPRVMNVDGGWVLGMGGKSILVREFVEVLTMYDPVPGSHTGDVEARLAALESEGVTKELAFPNSVLALFGWPDKEMRERCFRIYNEYIAEVQERSSNRIYGVGLINWWDAEGARRTLRELKALGLKTFLMPLSPGKDDDGKPIDFGSSAMDGVWEAIEEEQVPVSHHIGESPPSSPNEFNAVILGMLQSVAPFRDLFGKYVLGGVLDRHPGLRVGWFEGGINWVPSALQDAEHIDASFQHIANLEDAARAPVLLGAQHVRLVHGRPARARPDRPDRRRQGHVVDGLPAQREHLRLQQRVAEVRGGRGRCRGGHRPSSATTSSATSGWTADAGRADGRSAAGDHPGHAGLRPDAARAVWSGCRAIMRQQGLDALVLLGNTNVAYATGAIWPLGDSGRANFEQPVAVVLADDEWPHLFTPVREDDRVRREDAGRPPPRPRLPRLRRGRAALRDAAGRAGAGGGGDRHGRMDQRAAPRAVDPVRLGTRPRTRGG